MKIRRKDDHTVVVSGVLSNRNDYIAGYGRSTYDVRDKHWRTYNSDTKTFTIYQDDSWEEVPPEPIYENVGGKCEIVHQDGCIYISYPDHSFYLMCLTSGDVDKGFTITKTEGLLVDSMKGDSGDFITVEDNHGETIEVNVEDLLKALEDEKRLKPAFLIKKKVGG